MNTTFLKTVSLTAAFILFASLLSAQKLQPTIGAHYSGGFSYDMEQEPISLQVGLIYTPKTLDLIMSNIGINANYYYNFIPEKPGNYYDFYVLRLQFAKEFVQYWNVTYYVGYANNFNNDLMTHFLGEFRTNLAYGIGLQVTDKQLTAEILYESIAGYPHLSVGVNVNIIDLLKKKNLKNK